MRNSIFNRYAKHSLLLALIIPLLVGCSDVLEEDLTNDEVIIFAPPDNYLTTANSISFVWAEMPDALNYEMEIAWPSFDSMITLVADTNIYSNTFSIGLTPGAYEWRLRAVNGSSETPWNLRSFVIDSTTNLAGQTMFPLDPAHGSFLNDGNVTFRWSSHAEANRYAFRLYDFDDLNNTLELHEGTDTFYTYAVSEGRHWWSIEGRNDHSNTAEFGAEFWVDLTLPPSPVPLVPLDNDMVNDSTITFAWSWQTDSGTDPTSRRDSLYIHLDTLLTPNYRYGTATQALADSIGPGTWYWRVQGFDQANNQSTATSWRTLTVQ